jgi:hypothetical protein
MNGVSRVEIFVNPDGTELPVFEMEPAYGKFSFKYFL